MDLTPFLSAARAHQWLLLSALITGAVVAVSKQGWASTWIASKLTPATTPYYALLVSLLTTFSGDIVGGKTWQQAVTDGLLGAFTAMAGHQLLIKGVRGGKEIVPPTKSRLEWLAVKWSLVNPPDIKH